MKQEPVGVVCEFEGILVGTLFEPLPDGTKLYTAPKQLSVEKINEIASRFTLDGFSYIDFAQEILREANKNESIEI